MDMFNFSDSKFLDMRLGSRLFGATAILAFAICGEHKATVAAPVTFRFEAEVASVTPAKGGVELPFVIAPGDLIVTTFAFEPSNAGPKYSQTGQLRFEIGSHVLSVDGFEINVANDAVPNAVPLPGEIADPASIFFPDQGPGSSDGIGLGCLSDGAFFCGLVPLHPDVAYLPGIAFIGEDSLLNSTTLTGDEHVWNAFTFREMFLSFVNDDTNGELYVGAYIGLVQVVPEPDANHLFLFCISVFFVSFDSIALRQGRSRATLLPQHGKFNR